MITARASLVPGHILVHVDGLALIGNEHQTDVISHIVAKPSRLLLASLASCTCLTLRALADQNTWNLRVLDVDVELLEAGNRKQIHRIISVAGDLDDGQKELLLDAAETTEVTLHLRHGFTIRTELA